MAQLADLDLLLSEREIRRLAYEYARGGDRVDSRIFNSVFWPDGGYRQNYWDKPVSIIGDALINEFMAATFSCTHHMIGNILIDFLAENHATTEVYFAAFHLTQPHLDKKALKEILGPTRFAEERHEPDQAHEILVGGRYLDEVERRDSVWKISRRRMVLDYTTVRRSSGMLAEEGLYLFSEAKMARDTTDASYI